MIFTEETKEKELKTIKSERKMLDNDVFLQEKNYELEKQAIFFKEKSNKEVVLAQSSEKQKLLHRKIELEELERQLLANIGKKTQEKLADERNKNLELYKNLRKSYPF